MNVRLSKRLLRRCEGVALHLGFDGGVTEFARRAVRRYFRDPEWRVGITETPANTTRRGSVPVRFEFGEFDEANVLTGAVLRSILEHAVQESEVKIASLPPLNLPKRIEPYEVLEVN